MTTAEMEIDEVKKYLQRILEKKTHLPVMLWGPPGIGKSQAVKQVAGNLGWEFKDLRLSLLNPVDLRGLPVPDREKKRAQWFFPEFLPNGDDKPKGILFLDEINLAPASVMAAGYQLILDRRLGQYVMPKGWFIIAAGNRAEDQAGVTKFPAPLANRFIHIDMVVDDQVWRQWAIQNSIHEQIIAFLGKFPQHLFRMPKAGEKSFPTPRSWENASSLRKLELSINPAVGDGVGSEFYAFLRVYDRLPDVEMILKTGKGKVPKELDVLWALITAITVRAVPKNMPHVFSYLSRLGEGNKDFEVMCLIQISKKSDEINNYLVNSKEWSEWTRRNKSVINDGAE